MQTRQLQQIGKKKTIVFNSQLVGHNTPLFIRCLMLPSSSYVPGLPVPLLRYLPEPLHHARYKWGKGARCFCASWRIKNVCKKEKAGFPEVKLSTGWKLDLGEIELLVVRTICRISKADRPPLYLQTVFTWRDWVKRKRIRATRRKYNDFQFDNGI